MDMLGSAKLKPNRGLTICFELAPQRSIAEFSGFEGSKAVTRAIKEFKPDVLISAHIHEAGGLQEKIGKTIVLHVARKPTIFEI